MAAAIITACADPSVLAALAPHERLALFRPPAEQLAALVDIASDARGCVVSATDGGTLVGYVAFHPPTEVESWGADATGELIELGAIEVAPEYRSQNLARRLLQASFEGGRFDHTVVFATLYVWHYDLVRSGLTDLAYRRMLERLYHSAGMDSFPTSDEEIRSSAANALMARIGPLAPPRVVEEFHRLRRAQPVTAAGAW
ncbi:MAG: GNAT family N-acetyltransferase [Truepera sp.]|nr:GNAT family N-acetyltransferase [Truepera sp.]